jgi:hypothetical protein
MNPLLRIAKKLTVLLIIALVLTYIGDFLRVRYRIWKPRPNDPFESVKLDRFYAITQKNGREDYAPADTQTVTCVHSIFPHSGFSPCWYVVRQNGKPIQMAIVPIYRWQN